MELDNEQLYGLILLDTSDCSDIEYNEGNSTCSHYQPQDQLDTCSENDSDMDTYGTVQIDTCSEHSESDLAYNDSEDAVTTKGSLPAQDCCARRCIASFSVLELESTHSVFRLKTQAEQSQFIMDQLTLDPAVSACSSFIQVTLLTLNGRKVCKKAFVSILGTSHQRLKGIYDLWTAGVRKLPKRNKKPRTLSSKHTTMVAWLESYAQRLGEKMPHLDQIHLPHFLTKKAVYQIMKSEYPTYMLASTDTHLHRCPQTKHNCAQIYKYYVNKPTSLDQTLITHL